MHIPSDWEVRTADSVAVRVEENGVTNVRRLTIRTLLKGGLTRVELSSEDQPNFLHLLDLNDDGYRQLKSDQRIVVDRNEFPAELRDLLTLCNESPERFFCVFTPSIASSPLSVIERNRFREVVHIQLCMQEANDAALQSHLVQLITYLKHQREELITDVDNLTSEAAQLDRKVAESAAQIDQMKGDHLAALSAAREEAAAELQRVEERWRASSVNLRKEVEEADRTVRQLRDSQAEIDADLRSAKLGLQTAKYENAALKTKSESLSATCLQLETARDRLKASLDATENELQQSKTQIRELQPEAEAGTAAKAERKALSEKLSAAIEEIHKANAVIGKLQEQLKATKEKLKIKNQASAANEEMLKQLDGSSAELRAELGRRESELIATRGRSAKGISELERCQADLVDAHKIISNDKQVIDYLNKKLTEKEIRAKHQLAPTTSTSSYPSSGPPSFPNFPNFGFRENEPPPKPSPL